MSSTYTQKVFTKFIKLDNEPIIFECGSRDGLDAIHMLDYYRPSKIYCFECNPESIDVCRKNISNYEKIELIPIAVGDKNSDIEFFATDMEESIDKNIGASSALIHAGDQINFKQKKISVPCTRLDTFMEDRKIQKIDLLCLDLQGYEKIALEGMGDRLSDVKYIITEVNFQVYYHNQVMYEALLDFLGLKGFECREVYPYGTSGFGDALFERI